MYLSGVELKTSGGNELEERIKRSPGRPKIANERREQKILFDCGVWDRLPKPKSAYVRKAVIEKLERDLEVQK